MSPDQAALPASKSELVAALRSLATRKPQSDAELRQLERECVALALHMQHKMKRADIPHNVWHFLHDPDVRFKDANYANIQLAELEALLQEWEANGDI
jgi:predicted membrane chloride channel (bestrophin family)